jgi:hypothetical protein
MKKIRILLSLLLFITFLTGVSAECIYELIGDINSDCVVDLSDFSEFADRWLIDCIADPNNTECPPKKNVRLL